MNDKKKYPAVHIIIFFLTNGSKHRLKNLNKVAQEKKLSISFIDINTLSFNEDLLKNKNWNKKNTLNIGYFLGTSQKYEYLMNLLGEKILLPQKNSAHLAEKFNSFIFLKEHKIPTPKTTLLSSLKTIDAAIKSVGGFPCVIKRTTGSCGRFVDIAYNKTDVVSFISEALSTFNATKPYPQSFSFVLQKQITESLGTDYRALCIKDNFLGIIKRTSQNNSFKSNFSCGGKTEKIENIPEIEEISKKIMEESGLFIAGIDFIKSANGYEVIEINTSPEFKGFEKATNINVADYILEELLNFNFKNPTTQLI